MSGLVTVVAWVALVGCAAAGVLLALAYRRIDRLEQAASARKWDMVRLRAELGALRRAAGGRSVGPPPGDRSEETRRPTGATAWRRAHRFTGGDRRRRR